MARIRPSVPRTNADKEIQKWRNDLASVICQRLFDLPAYANQAAAVAGGLSAGDFYRTGGNPDAVCVVSP